LEIIYYSMLNYSLNAVNLPYFTFSIDCLLLVKCGGNTFWLINVVTLCLARLVPRWVTVFGQVNHLGVERGTQVYLA